MGYRSQVYLKTTTEGWVVMKKYNDSLEKGYDQPLYGAEVNKTESGFYKISFHDVKWYDSYKSVQYFNHVLDMYEEQDIPYSFVRLGEDNGDIEHRRNYPDDMPWQIEGFEPITYVNDEDTGYTPVDLD